MNKRDLVEDVCKRLVTTKCGSEEVVGAVLKCIQDGLRRDGLVAVAGFGTWQARERPARVGRNPQSGEPMRIAPRVTITFRAAKAWKDDLALASSSRPAAPRVATAEPLPSAT